MAKAEKFWDFLSKNYDSGEGDPSGRKDIEITRKYLRPSDVVLEYACGTGTLSIEIAAQVQEIHAIDISSKMLAQAKGKAAERKIENIHFTQTTIFEAGYPAESFDAVLAFNILHLLKDIRGALGRINDFLKPGGFFISNTPCMGENMAFSYRLLVPLLYLTSKLGIIPAVQILNKSELGSFITGEGFQIVETEDFHDETLSYFVVARKIESR